MKNYKLLIAYDGTGYCGWQSQKNGNSIQKNIEDALATILKAKISIIGAGRTDSGVHALGQVAHFSCSAIDPYRVQYSLNALLPDSIRILDLKEVDASFHARYDSTSKIYEYRLSTGAPLPFERLYVYRLPMKIDLSLLKEGSFKLIGKRDFTSLSNVGSSATNPVRTLKKIDIIEEGDSIRIRFEGDGFLYKMVRNITGLLLYVSSGKIPLNQIEQILDAKDRKKAPAPVPPHGLFLIRVEYT